jgi:glycosyltransferase involved in cell wall biosynthesis
VIVSGVRGTTEMVIPNQDALLFESRDFNALAQNLEKLILSKKLRSDLGKKARQSVIDRYSLYHCVTQLQEVIEEVYAR